MLQFLIVFSSLLLLYCCFGLPEQFIVDDFLRKFHQSDYEIKFERAEVVHCNKEYARNVEILVFKYNRTSTAFNVSFILKKDIGLDAEMLIQAYKLSGNDYKVFPIRFQINCCDVLSKNVFGLNSNELAKCQPFTGCPFRKERLYNFCNFAPDSSQFPPFLPSGRYRVEMQLLYISTEMYTFDIYLEIFRPFSGK